MIRKKYIVLSLLGLLAFLPLIPYIRSSSGSMTRCIFCDIVGGKMPQTQIEVETDEYVIFKDIHPVSTHHYLAVSKRHIDSLKSLTKEDDAMVANMEAGLKDFFASKNIDADDALFGFHLPPFISVKHLHMHGISPRSEIGFFHKFMFFPGTAWFKTVEEARQIIREKCPTHI